MNWSRVTSLEAWKGAAIEAAWKASSRPAVARTEPTWPLREEELSDISVVWPTEYFWKPAAKWADPIRRGIQKYVHVESADVPQGHEGIALIQMRIRGTTHKVAIDYADRPDVNEECARDCIVYFKMQFASDGYAPENIVPGGFIPGSQDIYTYLPRLRALRRQKPYRYDVYGRFGLEFAEGIRRKACSALAGQSQFRWEGSLKIRRYCLYLLEVARSGICVDLPGNGDFCFRLIDYMAVGACIIGVRHRTRLPVPLVDGVHIAYAKDDLSDLIDLCKYYLDNKDARDELCRNSRSYFDKYLHRDQLASYYVHTCLQLAQ
jgi:hypothetical protein